MKKLFFLICCIAFLQLVASAQTRMYEQATKILPEKMIGLDHSAKEVEVYKAPGGYAVEFYAVYGHELKMHKFIVTSEKPYNMANFTWETDNMLIMQFSSTDGPHKMIFRLEADKEGHSSIELIQPE